MSYALKILNQDILKAKLTDMLQTMPNSKETGLVWQMKGLVGVTFKPSNGT